MSTAITPVAVVSNQESAGKIGKIIGVIAAVVIPFAGPAIWGALTASGGILSGLGTAMTGAFGAGLTSAIGSAAVGGILIGAASAASGGNFWQGFGTGALGAGIGAAARGLTAAAQPAVVAGSAGTSVANIGAGLSTAATAGATATGAGAATAGLTAATTSVASPNVMQSLGRMFTGMNGDMLNRVGAAVVNAAVNGQNMGRLQGLVDQERAALDTLAASDRAAYDTRIATAHQLLADADRNEPTRVALMRMADVAGIEANEFRQSQRNIATRRGGEYNRGAQNFDERTRALHTGRSKARAYGEGFGEGLTRQGSLRFQGAQLLTPNEQGFRTWQAGLELNAGLERARTESNTSTWGGFSDAIFGGGDYNPATSPRPDEEDEDQNNFGIFGRD